MIASWSEPSFLRDKYKMNLASHAGKPNWNVNVYRTMVRFSRNFGPVIESRHFRIGWPPLFGIEYGKFYRKGILVSYSIGLPVPIIILVLLGPAVWMIASSRLKKTRRRRQGQCLNCGYNLTGLTEPRCPECGNSF